MLPGVDLLNIAINYCTQLFDCFFSVEEVECQKNDKNIIFRHLSCKLMRLDRLPAKFQSKSYSNRLLIDFFDPNLPVRSIVATILIRIWIQISILKLKFESEFQY